jgi:hypothetical protein
MPVSPKGESPGVLDYCNRLNVKIDEIVVLKGHGFNLASTKVKSSRL